MVLTPEGPYPEPATLTESPVILFRPWFLSVYKSTLPAWIPWTAPVTAMPILLSLAYSIIVSLVILFRGLSTETLPNRLLDAAETEWSGSLFALSLSIVG